MEREAHRRTRRRRGLGGCSPLDFRASDGENIRAIDLSPLNETGPVRLWGGGGGVSFFKFISFSFLQQYIVPFIEHDLLQYKIAIIAVKVLTRCTILISLMHYALCSLRIFPLNMSFILYLLQTRFLTVHSKSFSSFLE